MHSFPKYSFRQWGIVGSSVPNAVDIQDQDEPPTTLTRGGVPMLVRLECLPENLAIPITSKSDDYMSRSSSTKTFLSKLTTLFWSAHCLTFSKLRQVCWTSATSFALLSTGSHFQGSGVMSTEHIRLCLRASRQWERCSMPINSCVASQVRFDQMRFRIMFYTNRIRGPRRRNLTKLTTQWSWWNTLSDTT